MFKIHFEVVVQGLETPRQYDCNILVKADTPKAARDKAESYIKTAYSETYAILEVIPVSVVE